MIAVLEERLFLFSSLVTENEMIISIQMRQPSNVSVHLMIFVHLSFRKRHATI